MQMPPKKLTPYVFPVGDGRFDTQCKYCLLNGYEEDTTEIKKAGHNPNIVPYVRRVAFTGYRDYGFQVDPKNPKRKRTVPIPGDGLLTFCGEWCHNQFVGAK